MNRRAMGNRSTQSNVTTSQHHQHRTRSRMDEVVQAAAGNSQQSNSSPTRGKKRKVSHTYPFWRGKKILMSEIEPSFLRRRKRNPWWIWILYSPGSTQRWRSVKSDYIFVISASPRNCCRQLPFKSTLFLPRTGICKTIWPELDLLSEWHTNRHWQGW